jgi:hypothetical protein
MLGLWQALCTFQVWIYAVLMTAGIVGLAKSWMRFKVKYAEKKATEQVATKETTENQ